MENAAHKLEDMIATVEEERARVEMERRHTMAKAHNSKAQRLVSRLEQCDQSLASLLSEAAGCLQSLLAVSTAASRDSLEGGALSQEDTERLQDFESQAQDWFATLHNVQLGLRSAVRNLRKAQREPVAHDAAAAPSRVSGDRSRSSKLSAGASLGSATRGHSLALVLSGLPPSAELAPDADGYASSSSQESVRTVRPSGNNGQKRAPRPHVGTDGTQELVEALVGRGADTPTYLSAGQVRDEARLSLSALRMQDHSWRQLEGALRGLAAEKKGKARSAPSTASGASLMTSNDVHQLARDMVNAQTTRDARLMNALFSVNLEVVPETAINPMRGPSATEQV